MRRPTARPTARRGLTLVELMVTIALMLLIMSIIVALFTAATEGMTIARTDQEMASVTRRVDAVIRQDLRGVTARFTPPLDPNHNLGYFEYIENSFADAQGEDTDDILCFTAKAPPGQPFTGRIMLQRGVYPAGHPRANQARYAPTTITSDHAEIIYFLRNGNLYRRVLLVVPDRKDSLVVDLDPATGQYFYRGGAFNIDGTLVSWQGANDVSVRPPSSITLAANGNPITDTGVPVPNTLGDLTNRHNRAFRPRFADDYFTRNPVGTLVGGVPDGQFDDRNENGVADYYPTLTIGAWDAGYINDPTHQLSIASIRVPDRWAFPFLFPGAYSKPNSFVTPASINLGPYLGMPNATNPLRPVNSNHAPLDLGDNLPVPDVAAERWTWWGFPTWAETRDPDWHAATKRIGFNDLTRGIGIQAYGLSRLQAANNLEWLPPQDHWYSDRVGRMTPPNPAPSIGDDVPGFAALQDDLLATNVRSFDVKALDPNYFLYGPHANFGEENSTTAQITPQPANGRNEPPRYDDLGYAARFKRQTNTNSATFGGERTFGTAVGEEVTFGHEGRIPPLTIDNRVDPQAITYLLRANSLLGENSTATVRMRRTWDSWSTDYAFAPLHGINPLEAGPYADPPERPLYPSYPPPYPSPLFGIQIQIRLAAPDDSRAKVLTIRQDFTDKL
ncbi:PulJ/GspJ family protein [Tautonia plasticadhaerens]|uniref:Prepilin-type N-terminal cleavage/methylation domain-containing protein n=1 Tax=Tautonia plasticadhaerens TaxID=2527974 RepID=A0A518H4Y6_9BACT|nr:prepilin-type N-terminal cleavage/methylation domain-containing protein [Tautonia plasticadhaerens]QDV35899.1 hypothetical protein ElP_38070 [Tautonia plasticadhaerens]